MPYSMALKRASASPTAICAGDLCGNSPRVASLVPDKSTLEVSTIPKREARTPRSFLKVNVSMPRAAPRISVQIPSIVLKVELPQHVK